MGRIIVGGPQRSFHGSVRGARKFAPMREPASWPFLMLALLCALLFAVALLVGTVPIALVDVPAALFDPDGSISSRIVREVRLPGAVTALVAGMGLAVSGILMQTLFRNPLAGPSVLGISSGASLGVALVMLVQPLWSVLPIPRDLWLVLAAFMGGMGVLLLVLLADRRMGNAVSLLIIGLMIGHLCSALISVLQAAGSATALKGYVLWGMGSFSGVGSDRLFWLLVPVCSGVLGAFLLVKPLNALLLGPDQAATLGVSVHRSRRMIMIITGLLAGTVTAFCGPIAFLGLVTPHIARALFRTSDHHRLVPATALIGGALALFCEVLARLPLANGALPLNAVTSLLGAPVVVWILVGAQRWSRTT